MFQLIILVSFMKCTYSTPIVNQQSTTTSLDWRTKGVVIPPPDVNQCDHSISSIVNALDALSTAHLIVYKEFIQLSVQQIYDCGGDRCPGSASANQSLSVSEVYDIILSNKTLMSELYGEVHSAESYPYTGLCTNKCHPPKSGPVVKLAAYMNITEEKSLKFFLKYRGPVVVDFEANSDFELYTGGILDDPNCKGKTLNHNLLVVGYGTENNVDYWIARNSWGTNWGENGYVRIVRGKNMCGISNHMVLPLVFRFNYNNWG